MHNKKNYLLLATMILMVLVGCQTANNEATNPQDTTVTLAVESTVTPEATATPSVDVTLTATPVVEPEPTETPVATATPEATPTEVPEVEPTVTPVPTVEPTATSTPVPTATATPVPTATSTPTPTPKFTFKDMDKELYAKSSVNVRSLPSTDGDKLGSLSAWEKVKVTGQCNETSWYRIEYNNGIGYVSGNYLVTNKPTPTPTPVVDSNLVTEWKLWMDWMEDYNGTTYYKSDSLKLEGVTINFPAKEKTYYQHGINDDSEPYVWVYWETTRHNYDWLYPDEAYYLESELEDWCFYDGIIKTEINGFPCYINAYFENAYVGEYYHRYAIIQDIGNDKYIYINVTIWDTYKLSTSEDAHIKYVTPFILTQDQIQ